MSLQPPADLVLRGGVAHTVDPSNPSARAVAVRGGRIAAVGSDREIRGLIGPRTRVVELRGRTLLPGFGDSHIHPTHYGLFRQAVYLHELDSKEAYLDAIAAYAREHPDRPWITGAGWQMAVFPGGTPRREDLDRVVPDRPVYIVNRDVHGAWVNSKALELAGIDAATPDPDGGRIERDPDGTPTGTLHEWARSAVERLVPPTTEAERQAAIAIAQRHLHALGITGWIDAWVEPREEASYRAFAGRGELSARVVGSLWWRPGEGVEQVEELIARRAAGSVGRFSPTTVKIMVDGVLENGTGALQASYLDGHGHPTGNSGISFNPPEVLRDAVVRLDAARFQVHFHAIGDRACREALDALAAALAANGPTDGRHHIAHIQLIDPADLPRFAELGVSANMQPLWATHGDQMDVLTVPCLGKERAALQYPYASLARSGARLVGGSDLPVSTANVLQEVEVAVNRIPPWNRSREPFLPTERLSLEAAIEAFTLGSAHVAHRDDTTGSISIGKLADLIVLDRDLFDRGAGEIGEGRVVATFIDGETVFEDAALGG
jgi:predicted amidohydrolase YtcJ